jgi:hypothetical protein
VEWKRVEGRGLREFEDQRGCSALPGAGFVSGDEAGAFAVCGGTGGVFIPGIDMPGMPIVP